MEVGMDIVMVLGMEVVLGMGMGIVKAVIMILLLGADVDGVRHYCCREATMNRGHRISSTKPISFSHYQWY